VNYPFKVVHGELTEWLWSAIGGAHLSDRLPRPHASKHIIHREERALQEEGEIFLIKDFEVTCMLISW